MGHGESIGLLKKSCIQFSLNITCGILHTPRYTLA